MLAKTLAPLLLAFLLAACQSATQNVPQTVRFPRVTAPEVQPVTMSPVRWQVLTEVEIRAIAERRDAALLFALDPDSFRNMSLNLIEVRRHIEEQRAAIRFLQSVIDERSEPVAQPATTPEPR